VEMLDKYWNSIEEYVFEVYAVLKEGEITHNEAVSSAPLVT